MLIAEYMNTYDKRLMEEVQMVAVVWSQMAPTHRSWGQQIGSTKGPTVTMHFVCLSKLAANTDRKEVLLLFGFRDAMAPKKPKAKAKPEEKEGKAPLFQLVVWLVR